MIPSLIVLSHLNLYLRLVPSFDFLKITFSFLWLGIYMMAIDHVGSLISTYALKRTPGLFDDIVPFFGRNKNNVVTDFYTSAGIMALTVGKTAITSTGRAAIFVGLISGAGLLVNAHFKRQFQAEQNTLNRAHQSSEAQKHRDWKDYNNAKKPMIVRGIL